MSKTIVIYNNTTGIITSTLVGGDDYLLSNAALNAVSGETALEVADGVEQSTHYIDVSGTPTAVAKPTLDTICSFTNSGGVWTANGTDTISYGSALPNPTKYSIQGPGELNGLTGTITDGTITLTTAATGDYTINLKTDFYLLKVITITAV
jgi:hypothetical protein